MVRVSPRAGSLYTGKILLKKEGKGAAGVKRERKMNGGLEGEAGGERRYTNWGGWDRKRDEGGE